MRTSVRLSGKRAPAGKPPSLGRGAEVRRAVDRYGTLVLSVAMLVLVVRSGSPGWTALRGVAVAALTWAALRLEGGGPIARGLALLAIGVVGTVAGAAIGAYHLMVIGPTAAAVAGLIALAAGLLQLIRGGAALVRATPGWWRLLAAPAVLALLVFVMFPLTLAVNATNRPRNPNGAQTPADRGLASTDVEITTEDGVRLSGWYVPSHNGAAVLLLHGAGSTRSALLDHAEILARHGYGTLLLDTRGHGRSGGTAMDFGWYGDLDASAAISYLLSRPDVNDGAIGVVGLSMGGEQAIVAAGSDERIRAVVAEGVTGEQAADHGWLPGGINGAIQRGLEWVMFTGADLLSDASPPMSMRAAIATAAPRPFLLVAGGAVADEVVAGRWFQEAAPSAVTVWTVPGSPHIGALATAPTAWERTVVSFLDAALAPEGGEPPEDPVVPG